jgi:hypothetical protein
VIEASVPVVNNMFNSSSEELGNKIPSSGLLPSDAAALYNSIMHSLLPHGSGIEKQQEIKIHRIV